MRLYHSGLVGGEFQKRWKECGHYDKVFHWLRHRLLSWPYVRTSKKPSVHIERYRAARKEGKFESMMLDSGAFSAWTRNITLDLNEYVDFFLNHQDLFDFVVVIDKLPGKPGERARIHSQIKESAETSWRNTEYLLSQGMTKDRLIPVFHQGEDYWWLKFMLTQGFNILGISPANDSHSQVKRNWVKDCFDIIGTNEDGEANQRCHGFAVTDWTLVKLVPWFSVDSATWSISSGHGNIMIPGNCYKDYLNPKFASLGRKGEETQKYGMDKWIMETFGFGLNQVRDSHTYRTITHLYVMDKFSDEVEKQRPYLRKSKKSARFLL